MEDEILEGFARALFVSAWADACGELTGEPGDDSIACYACGAEGVGAGAEHGEDCEAYAIARRCSPGGGEDWGDYAPATTEHAYAIARQAIAEIEAANGGVKLAAVLEINAALDGHEDDPTGEAFGSDLAMQWLGTGVAWADDHPDHGLKIGHGEYHVHDVRDPADAWPPLDAPT